MGRTAAICAIAAALLLPGGALALDMIAIVPAADGMETLSNPGCGYAGGSWTSLATDTATNGVDLCANTPNCTKLWSLHKFSKGYVYGNDYTTQTNHYFHITNNFFIGGADIPLTENALLSISNSFAACRRNGGTCIPRFAYTWDGWGGAEPDDFAMVLTHIRQLGNVVSQFRDVIPAVECGIIGAYGEMHTSRYAAEAYQNQVVGAWLENLPPDMALLVRSPPVWMRYLGTTTKEFFSGGMESMDQDLRSRMGFYNDGYLGTDGDYGTWGSGGTVNWVRSQGVAFLRDQNVPYGGEHAGVTTNYFDANVHLLDPSRFNIVQEWYDTHLSYLRTIRSKNMTIIQRLTNTFFSSSRWAYDGMPDLSEYEGTDLRKFCEDHMGFRFLVRSVTATGHANGALLQVEVENTGFGRLLFDEAHDLVVAPLSGGAASVVPATLSRPLASIRGGDTATISIYFDYPHGIKAGAYAIYLRSRAPLADEPESPVSPRRPIRFANRGAYDDAIRANYICSLSLEDMVDVFPEDIWFSYRSSTGLAYGGEWTDTPEASGAARTRTLGIASPLPHGKAARIDFDLTVTQIDAPIDPDGGIASFYFHNEDGTPVPFGFTANGWTRLAGRDFRLGESFTLSIIADSTTVRYEADGVPLRDSSGRTTFIGGGRARSSSEVLILGEGHTGDIEGFLSEPAARTRYSFR